MRKHAYVEAYPKDFREQAVKLAQIGYRPMWNREGVSLGTRRSNTSLT